MRTLFDIGDEINVTLKGRIIEYSASQSGDCYTIELTDQKNQRSRVYLSSLDLENASLATIELNIGDEVEVKRDNDLYKGRIIACEEFSDKSLHYTVELTEPDGHKSRMWFSDKEYENSNMIRKTH